MLFMLSLRKVAQCSQHFGLRENSTVFFKTALHLLTLLWTTEVLINKIINEKQPRVVYFAS